MNYVDKDILCFFLKGKVLQEGLSLDDSILMNINLLVDDFYDLSKDVVMPLSLTETYIFRKIFGIYDNGIKQTQLSIARELNLSPQRINKIFDKIKKLILLRLCEQETSYNDKGLNMKINFMNLDKVLISILTNAGLYTVSDLVNLNIYELREINGLGRHGVVSVIDAIHEMGLYFKDERENILCNYEHVDFDEYTKKQEEILGLSVRTL